MKHTIHSAQQGWDLSPWLGKKDFPSLGTSLLKPSQKVRKKDNESIARPIVQLSI